MGKLKKSKPNYWYNQSAVVPYRKNGTVEILLITTRKKKKWIIPKGIVEENLTPLQSAEKEAFEEAGIRGTTSKKSIGKYKYKKWGNKCKVKVFAMEVNEVLDTWEEDFRERKWVKLDKVKEEIVEVKLQKIILSFF
ncbi:MAG: NUDIX hydrolase [Melioribacteraceae bacterium]